MAASSLRQRILSALVMAPVFLGLMYLGGLPFAVTIVVAGAISIYRFAQLFRSWAGFDFRPVILRLGV
jgi:hypothetical protein